MDLLITKLLASHFDVALFSIYSYYIYLTNLKQCVRINNT